MTNPGDANPGGERTGRNEEPRDLPPRPPSAAAAKPLRPSHEPEDPPQAEAPPDDDLYAIAEPKTDPPDRAAEATAPEWYVATAESRKEGPLDLAEMKQRITSGGLAGSTLVWRSGLPGWVPARSVAELFEIPPPGTLPPPFPQRPAAGSPAGPTAKAAEWLAQIDGLFCRPAVYRITGRVCAGLALLIFVISASLWFWGISWFTGVALLVLIFLIGEAAGAILETLGRVESQSQAEPESKESKDSSR